MRHPNTLDISKAALIVIDLQEMFRTAILDFDQIVARSIVMVRGAALLGVPILVTEQYPQKLGRTVAEILTHLPPETRALDKTCFSSCGASGFLEQLKARNVSQVILCGIEAHVCVNQTAHDLMAAGYQVHLLSDAISSRSAMNRQAGFDKMKQSGAIVSSVEMALFELMVDAKHERFKDVQKLVK
jgi:nicotinamidase-related amidase